MSRYFIEGETLTDIADAIRLKRDIVTEINPEDMPMEIGLIASGGGLPLSMDMGKYTAIGNEQYLIAESTKIKTIYFCGFFLDGYNNLPTNESYVIHGVLSYKLDGSLDSYRAVYQSADGKTYGYSIVNSRRTEGKIQFYINKTYGPLKAGADYTWFVVGTTV